MEFQGDEWFANSETLNRHFNLPSLSDCRNYLKLLFTCKLVYSPPGFLICVQTLIYEQVFIQDFELGGEQDGSRMIVACESMRTHALSVHAY